ncbi:MAG: hypothetical protein HRU48_09380 [Vibrio sp.]|uniref:hypothetical protein n=1 Tax=Vibrio sp. TaxID=678 RepID=UPI001ED26FE0|nr:hypothetical protein [Vibrio sp.]NRB67573.1 hypothetical protein [Vibrio sp.]
MKQTIILLILLASFKSLSSDKVYENIDGELWINNNKFPGILLSNHVESVSLVTFNNKPALEFSNSNNRNTIFTFSEKNPEEISCMYNNSRYIINGFTNRNAICGLKLGVRDAIKSNSNYMPKVSNKEEGFLLSRDEEGDIIEPFPLILEKYKHENDYINIEYRTLDDYINSRPLLEFKLKNKKYRENNYYIVYNKKGEIDHLLIKSNTEESWHKIIVEPIKKDKFSMCGNNINTVFSCTLYNNNKISLCALGSSFIYRYGTQDNIELEYPNEGEKPLDWRLIQGPSLKQEVFFNRGKYNYTLSYSIDVVDLLTAEFLDTYALDVEHNGKSIFSRTCKAVSKPFPPHFGASFQ